MAEKLMLQKIKELQEIGKSVIAKMTTNNDRLNLDTLKWLRWEETSIQELTESEIILKNESIDYSKVSNPQYGRFSLPKRLLEFSDRDFAKYVRTVVKAAKNRKKVIYSHYSEDNIKRLQNRIDYEINLLRNREKNKEAVRNLKKYLKEEYYDFEEFDPFGQY